MSRRSILRSFGLVGIGLFASVLPAVSGCSAEVSDDAGEDQGAIMSAGARYADQGWSSSQRNYMYFTSQGARILPYAWFLSLRIGGVKGARFASSSHLAKFGYLPEPASEANPDGLPVGFAPDGPPSDRWLGMTCTACHTGQLRYQGREIRIDGGQTLGNLSKLESQLRRELEATRANPARFAAFARDVAARGGEADTLLLATAVDEQIARLAQRQASAGDFLAHGPGRLDGIGPSTNELNCRVLGIGENCLPWNAPSTPGFIWKVQDLDFVNANAFTHSAFGRNVGAAAGFFANVQLTSEGLKSNLPFDDLVKLEQGFAALQPPRWTDPEMGLPPLSAERVARGREIYRETCQTCHMSRTESERTPPNEFGERFVRTPTTPLAEIGTDPAWIEDLFRGRVTVPEAMVPQFIATQGPLGPDGKTEPQKLRLFVIVGLIKELFTANSVAPGTPKYAETLARRGNKPPPDLNAYRAQPLEGIAFTAPYLHNGSVRSIAQLLLPPEQRDKKFLVGGRDFDPEEVGFVTKRSDPNAFELDTSKRGNSNAGHAYGTTLNAEDRAALLEYVKSL